MLTCDDNYCARQSIAFVVCQNESATQQLIIFFHASEDIKTLFIRSLMLLWVQSSYSQQRVSLCFCRSQPAQHLLSAHEVRPRQSAVCWKIVVDHLYAMGCDNIIFLRATKCLWCCACRNVRKMALRQSDSSSPESGFRRTNPSPNMRQKKGERSLKVWGTRTLRTTPLLVFLSCKLGNRGEKIKQLCAWQSANTVKFNVGTLCEKK